MRRIRRTGSIREKRRPCPWYFNFPLIAKLVVSFLKLKLREQLDGT